MKFLDLNGESTAENLAIDEVLLDWIDQSDRPDELLRLWENPSNAVVLGRSSKIAEEINLSHCQASAIPVYRRSSGGAAVVIGPGCLMYSVVLDYRLRPQLRMLDQAHAYVMTATRDALRTLEPAIQFQGTCDLTLHDKKFSGNSLRCKRNALLYHGTLLYDFPLDMISACLAAPPRQPAYRQGRAHGQFVTNLDMSPVALRGALTDCWNASEPLQHWPQEQMAGKLKSKFENDQWTRLR